jgi:protein-tyrosine phosphatase
MARAFRIEILTCLSPPQRRGKPTPFLEFSDLKERGVPGPHGGGPEGFGQLLDLVEEASRGLLDHVRNHLLRVST